MLTEMSKTLIIFSLFFLIFSCAQQTKKTFSFADVVNNLRKDRNLGKHETIPYKPISTFEHDSTVYLYFGNVWLYNSGYEIRTVYFNGNSDIYSASNEKSTRHTKIGYIYTEDLSKINNIFTKYQFFDYPKYLPHPQIKSPSEPLSEFVIGYRETPSDELKRVEVYLSARGKFPENFYQFLEELDNYIQKNH
jgi:hypothetical protein